MKTKIIYFAILVTQSIFTISKHDMSHDIPYQSIKTFLAQYKRGFTLLDIDADLGEYSFNIAQDFPDSVCVMIEANSSDCPNKAEQLFSLCSRRHLHNIIFLNKVFTVDTLKHLSDCEHFDVVLVMNGLYAFEDWRERLDALLNMGDNIIVRVHARQRDKNQAIKNNIIAKGGELLQPGNDPALEVDNALYLIRSNKKILRRKTWLLPPLKNDDYVIESSFSEKKLIKKAYWPSNSYQITNWIAGINLLTFKMCNGAYPSQETLHKSLLTLKNQPSTDWMINNMVIQGCRLAWIDIDDSARQSGAPIKPDIFSEEKFQEHVELLSLNVPEKIEHYFWFNLIRVPIAYKNIVRFFKPFLPEPSSVVFDIQPNSAQLLDVYLGHGAKVICFDILEKPNPLLENKFENDIIFANNEIMKGAVGDSTLDNMISLYRRPQLCNIHLHEDDAYTLLKSLSTPIPYLIFKFNIQLLQILKQSLFHLASIGYTQFNFSPRNIPVLGLNTNVHIGSQEKWVTAHQLLQEIDHFSQLDSKKEPFWGYIYARY